MNAVLLDTGRILTLDSDFQIYSDREQVFAPRRGTGSRFGGEDLFVTGMSLGQESAF